MAEILDHDESPTSQHSITIAESPTVNTNNAATTGPRARSRRYGFACSNCRRKKVRCGGEKPACANCCRISQEICHYGPQKSTSLQLERAQQEIQDLQEQLKFVQRSNRAASARSDNASISPDALPLPGEATASRETADEEDQHFWSQVSLDDKGSPNYHGSTSRFHLEVDRDNSERASNNTFQSGRARSEDLKVLHANSQLLKRVWEPLAYSNLNQHCDLSPDLASTLLQIYWNWQHPLHNCVYRPCFFRDMALGGPYFSPFLLMVIFAHAARHADESDARFAELKRGEDFLRQAKLLLLDEMSQQKPKIPTIQGLLILGGRQCAIGNSSEGWLYTGMAIRMLKDVGLHLKIERLKRLEGLDVPDLEARKRLYLSTYIWDKSISICLGRPPTLTEMPHSIDDILDHYDDSDLWTPVFTGNVDRYPGTQSYNTLTFKAFCRLGEIISQIYSSVYNTPKRQPGIADLKAMEAALYTWYSTLPLALKMDRIKELGWCPPPHIFSLNLLYHTLLILIYRPFLGIYSTPDLQSHAHKICSTESVLVNDLFVLYGKTYGYNVMTYLVSYCVYTAATINVHDIKSANPDISRNAVSRLSVSLRVLEAEAKQTPGIRRSIDIIKSQLRTWKSDDYTSASVPILSEKIQQACFVSGSGGGGERVVVERPNLPYLQQQGILFDSQSHVEATPLPAEALPNMRSSEMNMFDADFMSMGGGFQPNAFNWTLGDTWDQSTNFNIE